MLQVWRSKHDRDHPDTIKRRFVSAAFMTLVSPLFVWQCGAANLLDTFSISELLGLRTAGGSASSLRFCLILTVVSCLHLLFSGLVQASLLPLLLTMILFLGPTAMLLLDVGYTPCIVHILLILVSILSSYKNNSIFS